MIKFKLDLDLDEKALTEGLRSEVNTALSIAVGEATQHGRSLAEKRFKGSGKTKWMDGFKTHKVSDDLYVISIEGKIANWMEEGIGTGEISQAVMSGNRAKHNKAQGQRYVDVPMFKDADAAGTVSGTQGPINVRLFADADQMLEHLQPRKTKISDYKNQKVREERRVTSRIKDIIKSVNPDQSKSVQYLTIRRMTDQSVWPKTPFSGVKIVDDLGIYLDQNFEKILQRVIK